MAHFEGENEVKAFAAAYAKAERRMARCENEVKRKASRFADWLTSKEMTASQIGTVCSGIADAYASYARARDEYIVLDRLADAIGFSFDTYYEEDDEA